MDCILFASFVEFAQSGIECDLPSRDRFTDLDRSPWGAISSFHSRLLPCRQLQCRILRDHVSPAQGAPQLSVRVCSQPHVDDKMDRQS